MNGIVIFSLNHVVFAFEPGEEFTTIIGIDLKENFSIQNVQSKFGPAPIKRSGDAATSEEKVCYLTSDHLGVIEFGRGEVDNFFVMPKAVKQDASDCGVMSRPRVTANDLDVNGIKLGIDRDKYKRLVGKKPTDGTSTEIHHEFENNIVLTDAELRAALKKVFGKDDNWQELGKQQHGWRYPVENIHLNAKFDKDSRLQSLAVDWTEQW